MIPIIDSILKTVNKFIPDQESRDKLKSELYKQEAEISKLQHDLIKGEQNSDNWITRNWRPLFMALCGGIIGIHWFMYDVLPYVRTIFDFNFWIPQDPGLDPELWTTIRIGIGGYIGGRTAEKIVKIIKS